MSANLARFLCDSIYLPCDGRSYQQIGYGWGSDTFALKFVIAMAVDSDCCFLVDVVAKLLNVSGARMNPCRAPALTKTG